jgi:ribonucrease Y
MDATLIGICSLLGVLAGAFAGFKMTQAAVTKTSQEKLDESNRIADAAVTEAKTTAKRITDDAKRFSDDAKRIIDDAESKAEKIIERSENRNESIKQRKIQEAKEKFSNLKNEFEGEKTAHILGMKDREIVIVNRENDLKQRFKDFQTQTEEVKKLQKETESKDKELESIRENLTLQLKIIAKKKEELESANELRIKELERIANLTEQAAREQLLEAVRGKAENEAMVIMKNAVEQANLNANKEAKKIVIQAIQRMSAEFAIENTVSVFNLDSDDMKGQIIGREGRNIRALEAATGAEIVVDDTPEAIVISSFDPIRREIARLALKKLVADGRIHPARIEEVVAKTRKQLEEQIVEIGERTVIDLDIHGLDAALVRMVGRMRYRSSYGQNLLKHSIETANLCALMAAELGFNPKQIKMAKRAGLLHDIGKVAEEESELSHAILGMKLCEKHNEHAVIINAVGAHHDEVEMTNIISPIVQACDAISGARPGARREILESYLKRIGELEELALSHEGVQKAYAMQAGRELRVIVESEKVSDQYADDLSFMISQKIQEVMQYPGQIKVTVIREKRAVSFAR